MAGADQPWRRTGDGLVVRVRVTPRSSRERVWGIEATAEGPAVKVRVRAVPADGAANAAVAAVLADWLGVPNRTVTLAAGGKSRVKSFAVAGDPEALVALFKGKVAALAGKED